MVHAFNSSTPKVNLVYIVPGQPELSYLRKKRKREREKTNSGGQGLKPLHLQIGKRRVKSPISSCCCPSRGFFSTSPTWLKQLYFLCVNGCFINTLANRACVCVCVCVCVFLVFLFTILSAVSGSRQGRVCSVRSLGGKQIARFSSQKTESLRSPASGSSLSRSGQSQTKLFSAWKSKFCPKSLNLPQDSQLCLLLCCPLLF